MLPDHYREWIYLSSGLGMTYGVVESAVNAMAGQRFDNVFVNPQAYRSFLQTGTWPDKTVFVMEVRALSMKGSINKAGHFQQQIVTIEAHVKDRARYPSGWEFFGFGTGQIAKPLGRTSANPVPESGMLAKFESCAARALPAAQVKKLAHAIDQIEQCKSIRDFTAHIETVAI